MPSWKKIIVSGSDASLNSLNAPSITGSLQGTASFAVTASYVNTLNQNVLITGSLTVGVSSVGASENTLTLGARDAGSEGGQLGLNAPGGTYTSASMIDNYANNFRILRGSNAGSDALVAQWNMHTKQMQLPAYNSSTAFTGTTTGYLAFDSSGNIITTAGVTPAAAGSDTQVQFNNAGTTAGTAALRIINSTVQMSGSVGVTGSLTATNAVIAQANGAMYFRGGDDAELWDINVANTIGIYGQQNATVASVKLGSNGGTLSGWSSSIGIGTLLPNSGTLHVNGNVFATSFTGSLLGTASWASNAVTSSFITASNIYGPYGSNSIATASYAIYAETASISNATTLTQLLVLNQTGATINKGVVVRITGSNNASDIPRIATASYESDGVSANTLGIASANITNGSQGYVITEGVLTGIDTTGWTSGTLLFLGATGSITASAPQAPLHAVRLGQVIREQNNNGSIHVRVDNGYEISELHDVTDNTTNTSYGDLLVKSGSVWTNSKQLTGSYALTGSLIVTGSTTTDLIRLTQTGAGNALVVEDSKNPDSTLFVIDSSGSVGIGLNTLAMPSAYDTKLVIFPDIATQSAIRAYSSNNHAIIGLGVSSYSGVYGWNSNDSGSMVGVYGRADIADTAYGGSEWIGGKFEAAGDGVGGFNYSVQLIDGTEGAGKVLVSSTSNGKANWSTNLSGSYGLTGSLTVNGNTTVSNGLVRIQGNSSNELVRITQLGTGNAFVVEDSANPDATPFVIDNVGNVGIGTSSPTEKLQVAGNIKLLGTGSTNINIESGAGVRTYLASDGAGTSFGSLSNHNVTFYRNNAEFARITSTGLGIGTTSPNAKLDVNGNTIITGSLTVTDNFTVLGSSSIQYITSSQLNIGDNIISVNTINPAFRYGGISVIDSGSSPQQSGSLLFDSQNNQWIFVHQTEASSPVTSSVLIMGPRTFNNIGNETTITANRLTKGNVGDLGEHIGDSNITDTGTLVSINSNTEITGSLVITSSLRAGGMIFGNNGIQVTGSAALTGSLVITGSTSGTLVRITQTGAGNAFLVEDSANPDSNAFVIDSSGSVGIGVTTTSGPSAYNTRLLVSPENLGQSAIRAGGFGSHAIIGLGVSGYAGVYGWNANDSGSLVGVWGRSEFVDTPFSGTEWIGGKFEAAGDSGFGTNYSVQLTDGTEATGKVLVSQTSTGKANWSTRLSGSYEITGSLTVNGTIGGPSNTADINAVIQASLLYLSNNF